MSYYTAQNGRKIFFTKYGSSGPSIVLIHGLASSSRIWLKQMRVLRHQFQVYAIDLPGHGRSEKWDHYTFESLAGIIKEWMDFCRIPNAHIMALSLGCPIALELALRYPSKVNTLILQGVVGGYRHWYNLLGLTDWLVFQCLPIGIRLCMLFFGRKSTAHWINSFGVNNRRCLRLLEALQVIVDFKAVRQLLWEGACPPYVGKLSQLSHTVLLLRGHEDPLPRRFTQYLQTHIRNAVLMEIPDTRHVIAMEKPASFNQIVLDFLKVHSRNNRGH